MATSAMHGYLYFLSSVLATRAPSYIEEIKRHMPVELLPIIIRPKGKHTNSIRQGLPFLFCQAYRGSYEINIKKT